MMIDQWTIVNIMFRIKISKQHRQHESQSLILKVQKHFLRTSFICYKYKLMDIGSSVAIFLVLSLILIILFCLLTKYFHHKLTQNIQQAAEIYSMVDEMGANQGLSENNDGNYEKFKEMEMLKILKAENKKKPGYEEIQMAEMVLKTPLKGKNDDLYGPGLLKMRLNNEIIPRIMETGRSMSSLKEFKPEKLVVTNRTNRSNNSNVEGNDTNRSLQKVANKPDSKGTSYHTFINKFVGYDSQGITVVQINVTSIKKMDEGVFKENKTVKSWITLVNQNNFEDQLQIFGFEKGDLSCYKYVTKVEVNNMKINEDYALKTLKTCEIKQSMEIEEYLRVKTELLSNN